jgi:hypothetical protein
MRRFALALLILPGCLLLYAGDKDFWEQKPYTEWGEKDVDKLLKNSPWAKTVTLGGGASQGRDMSGMGGDEGGFGGQRTGGGDMGGGTGGMGEGGGGMRGGGRGGRGGGGGMQGGVLPSVVIAWNSQPVRQALARRLQLRNAEVSQEQVDRLLKFGSAETIEFLILGGGGGRGMGAANPDVLKKMKEETYLAKKNKEKIPLQNVLLPQGPGQPVVLTFPRTVEGKPTVSLDDKEIEVVTRLGWSVIRTRFKLAEMTVKGELQI